MHVLKWPINSTASILGCGGSAERSGRTTPVGECEESAALRVGDMKVIVGMFARCGRNPAVSDSTRRLCGWWLPKGAANNQRRVAEAAMAKSLNSNVSASFEHTGGTDASEKNGGGPPPVLLFNISADPNEKQDLSTTYPEILSNLLAKLRVYRQSEWMDPQWDAVQNYATCDTGPEKSCKVQEAQYIAAAVEKGCNNPFVKDRD